MYENREKKLTFKKTVKLGLRELYNRSGEIIFVNGEGMIDGERFASTIQRKKELAESLWQVTVLMWIAFCTKTHSFYSANLKRAPSVPFCFVEKISILLLFF